MRNLGLFLVAVALGLGSTGCGPSFSDEEDDEADGGDDASDESSTGTEPTSDTSTSDGGETDGEGEGATSDGSTDTQGNDWNPDDCGALLCAEATFWDPDELTDPNVLCVLEALRDPTPGWTNLGLADRDYSQNVGIVTASDRSVTRYDWGWNGPEQWDKAYRCTLKPASFFDGCLETPEAPDDACLDVEQWFESCQLSWPPECP